VSVSSGSIGGGRGQYLPRGSTRGMEEGGSEIQQRRAVCSSGLQGTGRTGSTQGGELGLLQGGGTFAEFVSGGRDAEWHRLMPHSPTACRGRAGWESRNENLNACLPAAEDGAESKALNADGREGAEDAVD